MSLPHHAAHLGKVSGMKALADYVFSEMARFFQFPSLWELFSGAVLPLSAIIVASIFVIKQIRQAESHKAKDRKAQAAAELTNLAPGTADLVAAAVTEAGRLVAEGSPGDRATSALFTQMDRYRLNGNYVRAFALLLKPQQDFARWAQDRSIALFDIPKAMMRQGHPLPHPETPENGAIRAAVTDASSELLLAILHWSTEEAQPPRIG